MFQRILTKLRSQTPLDQQEAIEVLLNLIRKNRSIQNEVYQSFRESDLKSFLDNLSHPEKNIRKIAGLFLCELLYNNQQLQMLFCDKYNILYSKGKVALNQFPKEFAQIMKQHSNFLGLLKGTKELENKENSSLCWFLTPNQIIQNVDKCGIIEKKTNIQWQEFPDPRDSLMGFIINDQKSSHKSNVRKNTQPVVDNFTTKQNSSNSRNQEFKNYIPDKAQIIKNYEKEKSKHSPHRKKLKLKNYYKTRQSKSNAQNFKNLISKSIDQSISTNKGKPQKYQERYKAIYNEIFGETKEQGRSNKRQRREEQKMQDSFEKEANFFNEKATKTSPGNYNNDILKEKQLFTSPTENTPKQSYPGVNHHKLNLLQQWKDQGSTSISQSKDQSNFSFEKKQHQQTQFNKRQKESRPPKKNISFFKPSKAQKRKASPNNYEQKFYQNFSHIRSSKNSKTRHHNYSLINDTHFASTTVSNQLKYGRNKKDIEDKLSKSILNQRKSIDQTGYFSRHKKKPSVEIKQLETNLKKTQNLIKKLRQTHKKSIRDNIVALKGHLSISKQHTKHSKHKSKGNVSSMITKNKYKASKNISPNRKKVTLRKHGESKKYGNKAYNLFSDRYQLKNKYESYRYKN